MLRGRKVLHIIKVIEEPDERNFLMIHITENARQICFPRMSSQVARNSRSL
jgi:hypothetical protein